MQRFNQNKQMSRLVVLQSAVICSLLAIYSYEILDIIITFIRFVRFITFSLARFNFQIDILHNNPRKNIYALIRFCIISFYRDNNRRWDRKSGNGKIYRAFQADATMYFIHRQSCSQHTIFLYFLAVTSKYVQD